MNISTVNFKKVTSFIKYSYELNEPNVLAAGPVVGYADARPTPLCPLVTDEDEEICAAIVTLYDDSRITVRYTDGAFAANSAVIKEIKKLVDQLVVIWNEHVNGKANDAYSGAEACVVTMNNKGKPSSMFGKIAILATPANYEGPECRVHVCTVIIDNDGKIDTEYLKHDAITSPVVQGMVENAQRDLIEAWSKTNINDGDIVSITYRYFFGNGYCASDTIKFLDFLQKGMPLDKDDSFAALMAAVVDAFEDPTRTPITVPDINKNNTKFHLIISELVNHGRVPLTGLPEAELKNIAQFLPSQEYRDLYLEALDIVYGKQFEEES